MIEALQYYSNPTITLNNFFNKFTNSTMIETRPLNLKKMTSTMYDEIEQPFLIQEHLKSINFNKLNTFKNFGDNWNGYGAKPFSSDLIVRCEDLISKLGFQPYITPTGRECIQFEYELENNKYLEFEIFENKINMLLVDEDGNEIERELEFDFYNISEEIFKFHE